MYSVTCPQCNEKKPGSKLTCTKCGASLTDVSVQVEQPSQSESSAVQDALVQQRVAVLQEKQKIENKIKVGADSFLWIAGLSLINSIVTLFGGSWRFLMGLGATLFVDAFAIGIARAIGSDSASIIVRIIAFIIDIGILGIFVALGILARKKHKWAFIVGIVLYGLDTLVFLIGFDIVNIVFHIFILAGLSAGLRTLKKLEDSEQKPGT
jgi:hypothetical protein